MSWECTRSTASNKIANRFVDLQNPAESCSYTRSAGVQYAKFIIVYAAFNVITIFIVWAAWQGTLGWPQLYVTKTLGCFPSMRIYQLDFQGVYTLHSIVACGTDHWEFFLASYLLR